MPSKIRPKSCYAVESRRGRETATKNTRGEQTVTQAVESNKRNSRAFEGTVHSEIRREMNRVLLRAETALRSGQYMEAAALASQALSVDEGNVGALETLAKALWQAGRYEELLASVNKLIRLNPYEPGYRTLLGATLQCLGRYGEAVRAYDRAGDHATAQDAIQELHGWQASLVQELLKQDPVFRAHYEQNPQQACEARGFEFISDRSSEQWFAREVDRASAFVRPS